MRAKGTLIVPAETASTRALAYGEELIARVRFVPPRPRPNLVARPRLQALLAQLTAYPLTLVRAEAGYGKTTAVAAFLPQSGLTYLWYNLADGEADPLIYLLHLIYLFRSHYPETGGQALALLAQATAAESRTQPWLLAVDALANDLLDWLSDATVLVLEDYDSAQAPEINAITERLIEHAPPGLHIVITARSMPSLRGRAPVGAPQARCSRSAASSWPSRRTKSARSTSSAPVSACTSEQPRAWSRKPKAGPLPCRCSAKAWPSQTR